MMDIENPIRPTDMISSPGKGERVKRERDSDLRAGRVDKFLENVNGESARGFGAGGRRAIVEQCVEKEIVGVERR